MKRTFEDENAMPPPGPNKYEVIKLPAAPVDELRVVRPVSPSPSMNAKRALSDFRNEMSVMSWKSPSEPIFVGPIWVPSPVHGLIWIRTGVADPSSVWPAPYKFPEGLNAMPLTLSNPMGPISVAAPVVGLIE